MMHWVGYRVVELDGSNPGKPCLLGPFGSYHEAKRAKEGNRARDMKHTVVFTADSEEEALELLRKEPFSRL